MSPYCFIITIIITAAVIWCFCKDYQDADWRLCLGCGAYFDNAGHRRYKPWFESLVSDDKSKRGVCHLCGTYTRERV